MNFMKYLLYGVSWGCTVFVLTNLVGYWIVGDVFLQKTYENFINHVVGSIIVGIGCATPSIVYQVERLTFLQQALIHFSIGLTTFFIAAFSLKWIPTTSIFLVVLMVVVNILIFTVVWLLFYLYNRHEVKKMNEKISEYTER